MANQDYVPPRDGDFNVWVVNFANTLNVNYAAYGLTLAEKNQISTLTNTWTVAFIAALGGTTRSPATIAAKDAARLQLVAALRPLAVRIILNPSVSNSQREALGVTVRSGVRTPTPPIATAPALYIVNAIPLQIKLQYRDVTTPDSKDKPKGCTSCQIFASVGTVPSISPEQAAYKMTVNKTPFVMPFISSEQGKVATLWSRWFAPAGPGGVSQVGPWSSPLTFNIL